MRDSKRTRRTWSPRAERDESYNALKARWELAVIAAAKAAKLPTFHRPVALGFFWWEPDMRRDPDNIAAGGRKIILDGLVKAAVLLNDRHACVFGFTDDFLMSAPGKVVVEFMEPGNRSAVVASLEIPHRLPDLNELLRARELGARRILAKR